MTLSAHRRAERQSAISEIVCTDEFSKKLTLQTNEDEIFAKLPSEFKTRDALNLCETLKIPYLK